MPETTPQSPDIIEGVQTGPHYEYLLEITKHEQKERSVERAELIYLGNLMGETTPEHWTGGISLKKRINIGELSQEEVVAATGQLNECFVPTKIGAPKRCVDGSTIEGYDDSEPAWYGRGLGPQVQGGISGDASGERLAKGYESGATLFGDIKKQALSDKSSYSPGDHTDDHADGEKTGCGQVDGHKRRSEIYVNERNQTLLDTMRFMYDKAGLNFPDDKVKTMLASGKSIYEHSSDYYKDNQAILPFLKEFNPNSVEKLIRPHNEISLTLNFVDGDTFHRDHYNSLTNSKIQNFNLDVWNIIDEHGENAFFVIADAVTTVIDLTDGTLMLFARVPKKHLQSEKQAA